MGAGAEMHEVVVVGRAVGARVLRHGRHHHAVGEREAAQLEGREHRRDGLGPGAAALGQPRLHALDVAPVTQAQILVGDALRAREEAVGELLGLEARVALDPFEPLGGIARGVLDLEHLDRSHGFVTPQHAGNIVRAVARKGCGELDRVLERELGARAHREVRRMSGVPHEDHRHLACVVNPCPACHARKADPLRRAAQMARVGHELVSVEIFREQALAKGEGLLLLHPVESGCAPGLLGRLDDEGRGVRVELVGVRLEPAVRGLLEGEGEGVEALVRAEPDEAALAQLDLGLEGGGMTRADGAVETIGGDDELRVDPIDFLHVGLEHELHAERLAARLQDVEETPAADAAETVAAGSDGAALEVDVDVVPVMERLDDAGMGLGVGGGEVAEGLAGEDHAPAEGVVAAVALEHGHLVRGVGLLHEEGQVQARRAAADADNAHAPPGVAKTLEHVL